MRSRKPSSSGVSEEALSRVNVSGGVPLSLLNNLKHNHVLHERVILLSVVIEEVPDVSHVSGSGASTWAATATA